MAVFTPDTVGNIKDLKDVKKIQEYLYRLNEQLQYVLRNLTPEDNDAAGVPSLSYATGQTVKIIVDGDELDIVLASEVIKSINESIETAKINAGRVNINGIASTGNKFAISSLGVPSMTDGTISGTAISDATVDDTTMTDTDHQSGKVGPFDVDSSGISGTNVSIPDTGSASLAELTLADAFWNGQTVTQICQTMWNALFP